MYPGFWRTEHVLTTSLPVMKLFSHFSRQTVQYTYAECILMRCSLSNLFDLDLEVIYIFEIFDFKKDGAR